MFSLLKLFLPCIALYNPKSQGKHQVVNSIFLNSAFKKKINHSILSQYFQKQLNCQFFNLEIQI